MEKALKPKGVLYACFKHGKEERSEEGRFFSDLDESGAAPVLADHTGFGVLESVGLGRCSAE